MTLKKVLLGWSLFVFLGVWSFSEEQNCLTIQELQELIDKSFAGSIIFVPPGNWKGTLFIRKSLTLQGKELGQVFLEEIVVEGKEIEVKLENLIISNSERSGIKVKGEVIFEIVNSRLEGNKSGGIWIETSSKVKIKNCLFKKNGYGVFAKDKAEIEIENSCFENNKFGAFLLGKVKLFVLSSTFALNEFTGISANEESKVFVQNSTIELNQNDGISCFDFVEIVIFNSKIAQNKGNGIYLAEKVKATLSGNKIYGNQKFGIFSLSLFPINGEGNIIEKNEPDLGGNVWPSLRVEILPKEKEKREIFFPGSFTTLQEAIDILPPESTIILLPGKYKLNIFIWKPLYLKGSKSQVTIIEGTISIIGGAQNVKIEELTISGSLENGIVIGGDAQVEIKNVIIEKNQRHGIFLLGSCRVSVFNVKSLENLFGIGVFQASEIEIRNSRFERNEYGISLFGLSKGKLQNSKFVENKVDGIYIHDLVNCLIERVSVERNGRNGISIFGESQVFVLESEIKRNGTKILIEEGGHGILIGPFAFVTLERNEISYNKHYGVYLLSAKKETFEFLGKVCGKGNLIFWNSWGKTRPASLEIFLTKGGCYQKE